jgi:hypothetical protein
MILFAERAILLFTSLHPVSLFAQHDSFVREMFPPPAAASISRYGLLLFFFLIDMWSICFLEGFDCGDRHRAALQAVHLGPGLDLKTVFRSGGMPSKMISHSLHRLLFLVFS